MEKNNYNVISKWIHKLYLGNYFASRTSFDLEQVLYKNEIQEFKLNQIVFVTGLARAGTTALFRAIYESGNFASLKYSNMPFLLMPIIWSKIKKDKVTELKERAHNDGLKVNSESPEAFDEYFWKIILEDAYIKKEYLYINSISEKQLVEFEKYLKSVCISSKKDSYLSKNNNNILRIPYILNKFKDCKIILVYRDPLEHAKSLLMQHQNFCNLQKLDSFALDYFNYLGHHEFGLNHKIFKFNTNLNSISYKKTELNYWLTIWLDYYSYALELPKNQISVISFFDLCNYPDMISNELNQFINSSKLIVIQEKFNPLPHKELEYDNTLLEKCLEISKRLDYLRNYTS